MLRIRLQCNDRTIGEIRSSEITQEIVIGRSSSCTWRIASDDGLISGQHAVLTREGRHVWLRDQCSKNGTWFKGKRVKQRKLRAGDHITMGHCVLVVEKDLEKAASQSVPEVVVLTGKFHKEHKPIKGTQFTIGSDPKADLSFLDDLVSRHHAVIERKTDGFWLKDLGSTNGTKVNGAPLRPQQERLLKDGDHIIVAHMEFVFHDGTGPRDQGQALRRLVLMAAVALIAAGGYYAWQLIAKDSAEQCFQGAQQLKQAGEFDEALRKLDAAIDSLGYKDWRTPTELLRRQIDSCRRNAALRADVEKHLRTQDWSAAARVLGELLSLPGESWEWRLGPDEKKRAVNVKRLLDAYLDACSDISRPDIPLDKGLEGKSQILTAAIRDMESVKELQGLNKIAGERLKALGDQAGMYRELHNVLRDLETSPPPDVRKVLSAVETIVHNSDGALRQRAESILRPLQLLSGGYAHLLKMVQLVHDMRFKDARDYANTHLKSNLPAPSECVIDSGLYALSTYLQKACAYLEQRAQDAESRIDALQKRVNGASGMPEELRFLLSPTAMEKALSCDSLNGSSARRTRKEPQGEYDHAVFIEGFYDYLCSIVDGQPGNYAEAPFKCALAESFPTVRAAKNVSVFFATPENQDLRAGELAQWEQAANRILGMRDKIVGNLLNTARQSSGRKAIIATGIAWRLMDAPEKENMNDQPLRKWLIDQFKNLQREVQTLDGRREAASEAEERIRLRDEILKVGLPGNPIVRRMWADRPEAGTNSEARKP